jgi:hemerythrin
MNAVKMFEWSDRFLLGYEPMDRTHREFVELVEAMLAVDDPELCTALDSFAGHAESHFAEEEKWMGNDFPARECHIEEHEKVLNSVREVQQLVAQDNFDIARHLAENLMNWFAGHADYMDSALAVWMSKKKFGGAPLVFKRNQFSQDS